MRDDDRLRPVLAAVGRVREQHGVGGRRLRTGTTTGRSRLAVVGRPGEVERPGRVLRELRLPERVERRTADGRVHLEAAWIALVEPRCRARKSHHSELVAVDGRFVDGVGLLVVDELAVAGPVVDLAGGEVGGAARTTIGAAYDDVPVLLAVAGEEHLLAPAACEPGPVALVALCGAGRPRESAVGAGDEGVVGEIDAGGVDVARVVFGQVRVGEPEV